MFLVQLKESVNPSDMNVILEKMGSKQVFITAEMNQSWLDDINLNPDSPQRHLKPSDRDLTMEELKRCFGSFTEESVLRFDTKYERATNEEIVQIAQFVEENQYHIDYVLNVKDLTEKGAVSSEQEKVLDSLEKEPESPEMLPEDEQYKPDLQSGLLLCKSFSPQPFWVMFGSVDKPRFLKERIYKEDIYNRLYRDENGLGYLLIPLYDFSKDFFDKVFDTSWDVGLREHPTYFGHMIYNLEITSKEADISEEMKKFYSVDERVERLKKSLSKITSELRLHPTTIRVTNRNRIVAEDKFIQSKLKMTNALLLSLKDDYSKIFDYTFDRDAKNKHTLTFSNNDKYSF